MDKLKKDIKVSVRYVKGIGPKRAAILQRIGIETVEDLFSFFPHRYEDRSQFRSLAHIAVGEFITIKGVVCTKGLRYTRPMKIFEMVVEDGNGKIYCSFFNQPYLNNTFNVGDAVIVSGKVEMYKKKLQLNSPEYEILKDDADDTVHTGRIVPVYHLTEGLTQRSLRQAMKGLVETYGDALDEILPAEVIKRNALLNRQLAYRNIHFPENNELLKRAEQRIVFEEFFIFECIVADKVNKRKRVKNSFVIKPEKQQLRAFLATLDFNLTVSQKKAVKEISDDLSKHNPMNRLLQGDVGSGKTVVATFALYICAKNKVQGAFMVPTEILAEQHFITVQRILNKLNVSVALLTGSTSPQRKKEIIDEVARGDIDILIGTHALIQESVIFNNLGFVVIDEQHKFGVRQRAYLPAQETKPHLLVMTATPIPRTLGLIIYADLDISTLRDLPYGERKVKTFWITKRKEAEIFTFVKERLRAGDQAYIVFPLIEETEKMDLAAATEEYENFKKGTFAEFKLGLVHGRLERGEKNRVMTAFRTGRIHLLVSTTVIEVGIDNPNATIIIIEHAERFGLSQLHQMRGRVGRARKESYCFLFGTPTTESGKRRLRLLTKTNDGFKIAEEDLYLRGPGDFLGVRQSGLPEFRLADIVRDADILKLAKKEAFSVTSHMPPRS